MNRFLILMLSVVNVVYGSSTPCDNPNSDCNIITSENFAHLNSKMLTYPQPTTTIYNNVTYDAVYHWVPETGHELLHSFVFYTTGQLGSCSDSAIWNNGQLVNLVEETRDGLRVCYAPISEQFDRDDLSSPEHVYFLFKNIVNAGNYLFIDRDSSKPVLPEKDVIFFLYEWDNTVLESVAYQGTTITIDINEIVYNTPDFKGIGDCETMDKIMEWVDISGCSIRRIEKDSENSIYKYYLPYDDYMMCVSNIEMENGNIVYTSIISLFLKDDDGCLYFQPNDHIQTMRIIEEL